MEIKILGPDSTNSDILLRRTITVLNQLHIEATVEKIEDPSDTWSYGLIQFPAFVVGRRVISQGSVLTEVELRKIIQKQVG